MVEHECDYKEAITSMRADITKISKGQDEIKDALIGTYEKKGIVTEVKQNTLDLKRHRIFNVSVVTGIIVAWVTGIILGK